MVVALATAQEGVQAVGVDLESVGEMPAGVAELAFTSAERDLLAALEQADWPLRLWCAKEAAGKALGRGLRGGPQALVITAADPGSGAVTVVSSSSDPDASPGGIAEELHVQTLRADGLICAWCLRAAPPAPAEETY
jgi:phosphopantetheinyl transferase